MKQASFYAAYIVKKLWTLAAIVLVILALSMSVLRFSLPYMDQQKHRLEDWLSNQYGVDLAIGELNASWTKSGPSLILKDVFLKQNEQSPVGLEITETLIEFDFWGSVSARQVQSQRFDLNGLVLTINMARIQASENEFPIVEALENLFLEQLHQFSVRNSVVDVTTRYDQQLIQIQQLSWINKDQRHQGVGQLRVVELANNSATFTLDLYGGKDNLHGTFNASGEELDLSPWLNQLVRTQNKLVQSRGNFTFWAQIGNNRVENVQIELAKSEFEWQTPEANVEAAVLGGYVRAVPDDLGWRVNVEDLMLESSDQSLNTSWTGHIDTSGKTRFNNIDAVNLQAILPLLPLAFDAQTIDFIDKLDPTARLDSVSVQLGENLMAEAEFSQISWNQVGEIPGLANLTGRFVMNGDVCRIGIQGVAGELMIDNVLDNNVDYRNLQLDAFIQWHDRGIAIDIPRIAFDSDIVSLEQQIHYDTHTQQLAMNVDIDALSVKNVKALFPTTRMGVDTKAYLERALKGGAVNSATLVWQGDVGNFPFEDNKGVFQAAVDMQDVTFSFQKDWPSLTELDIDLFFENNRLDMYASSAKLMDVSLGNVNASIASLAEADDLKIDARVRANSEEVVSMLKQSTLAGSVGEALTAGVNIAGQLDTKLNLTIPLSSEQVVAAGKIKLDGNQVYVPSIDLTFTDTHGYITFVNDDVRIEQLSAELLGQAVSIDFTGISGPQKSYLVDVVVAGDWQVEPLLERYKPQFGAYLSGKASWQANTKLTLFENAYAYSVEVSSDLLSIDSTLPAPFAKTTGQNVPLLVTINGQNKASSVKVSLADNINFDAVLPHDTMQFSRAHLSIGDEETMSMGLGFSIFANVPEADFDAWYEAISVLLTDMPKTESPLLESPQRIYVNANNMLVAGQNIENLELVAKRSSDDWLLTFNAEQIRAKATFYDDWLNRGIEVKADFIELTEWQGQTSTLTYSQSMLQNLPPVTFECKDCRIFDKDLGKVEFSLSRAPSGMQIDNLRFNNDHGVLEASGLWAFTESGSHTSLQGELNSSDFGALLKNFGVNSGIKDSEATFAFNTHWQDAPHKFSLASLDGNIDWRLSDGYLSEVSDKGARIFSILSLQSLVRKLSLDFRDVFAKGFFYDKMRGSFQLEQGRAATEDTVIDGAAGEMSISGYANLATQDLNYVIEFTPNVTSSLPLLVYWMVNPATAIAALAIDQVLTEAKVISNVRYSVTGNISDPILTELGRKSKEVILPAQASPPVNKPALNEPPVILPGERIDMDVTESELQDGSGDG